MAKDMFGLTPLHIWTLSARPSVAALQKLLDGTSMSTNAMILLRLDDKSRVNPLRYAIENYAPDALAFIKAILHTMIEKRLNGLGLELWKLNSMLQEIESFGRIDRVHKLFALLRLYERKKSISLQYIWKGRMVADGDDQERHERPSCRRMI
mmetsp:Transcript_16662/g.40620  ORF Transcript_16662/g.40620 Transcript_16662/m.40620 type:complete len:152 (-) Transcript_16662:126-581(-)